MASWSDLEDIAGRLGGQYINNEMILIDLLVQSTDTKQQVYLIHELMKPDLEFVKIVSPIGTLRFVDIRNLLLSRYGSMTIGGFQCIPSEEAGGTLTLGTCVPLALLDLSQPTVFMLTLSILASAAQGVSRSIGGFGQ